MDGAVYEVSNILTLSGVEMTHKETGEVLHGMQAIFTNGESAILYNCDKPEVVQLIIDIVNEWTHSVDILTLKGFLIFWIHKHFKIDLKSLFRKKEDDTLDLRQISPTKIQEKIDDVRREEGLLQDTQND